MTTPMKIIAGYCIVSVLSGFGYFYYWTYYIAEPNPFILYPIIGLVLVAITLGLFHAAIHNIIFKPRLTSSRYQVPSIAASLIIVAVAVAFIWTLVSLLWS